MTGITSLGKLDFGGIQSDGKPSFNLYDATSASGAIVFQEPTDYTAWKCREKIKVVSPHVGESVSTLTVTYDSDMNTDFSDIRFSTLDGVNIPYSLKTKTDSTSAVFDLWMPSDDIRVYLYYGNSNAEIESSEASTHLDRPLFDLSFDNLTMSNTGTSSAGIVQLNTTPASRFDLSTYDARNFPGSSYILLTSANELQGLQEFTYRTYVNYSSSAANGYGGIFRGINGCVGDSRLYVNASDNSLVLQENGTTVGTSAASVIADDTWQLVEMTFDGTTTNVYVDGTNVITTSTPDWTSSASAIYIGRGYTDNTYDFEGKIDDVKIYNYVTRVSEAVLTEMTKDYNPYYLGYVWNCMREVKAIDITDSPTVDAQVEITITAPTGMYSSSFDDVRFSTDDGKWIDFYRVSYTSGVSAVFGLELPANTTRIKMYYGNTEAEYTGDSELFGTLNTTPTFTFNPAGYNIGYYLYDWTGFKHQSTIIVEDIPEKHTPTKLTLTKADYTLETDLSDLRCCDVDGNYLPYWIESDDGTTILVWTVVPASATRFFMRNGKSSTVSESNSYSANYSGTPESTLYLLPEGFSPEYVVSDLSGFTKKAPITISNPHTDRYPVRLQVPYQSSMQADFSDLEFVDGLGRRCPHWIETYTASTEAYVWVLTPAGLGTIDMYYGDSGWANTSNGEQVFPLGFDDFDLPVDADPSGQWVVEKYKTASSGDYARANGASGMVLSKGADRGSVYLKTRHKFPCGVVATYRTKRSISNYGAYMFGPGEPAGEYGGTSNEWFGTLGPNSIMLRIRDATSTTQNKMLRVTETYTISYSWVNGEPIYDALNEYKTHRMIWNETEIRLFSNELYSDHLSAGTAIRDSYFAFVQGYYNGTGTVTVDWVGFYEYVETEPTISIGTAGANPEYVGGEEPTYNLLVGFTGSNF